MNISNSEFYNTECKPDFDHSNAGEKSRFEEINPFEIRTSYAMKKLYEGDFVIINE